MVDKYLEKLDTELDLERIQFSWNVQSSQRKKNSCEMTEVLLDGMKPPKKWQVGQVWTTRNTSGSMLHMGAAGSVGGILVLSVAGCCTYSPGSLPEG